MEYDSLPGGGGVVYAVNEGATPSDAIDVTVAEAKAADARSRIEQSEAGDEAARTEAQAPRASDEVRVISERRSAGMRRAFS